MQLNFNATTTLIPLLAKLNSLRFLVNYSCWGQALSLLLMLQNCYFLA